MSRDNCEEPSDPPRGNSYHAPTNQFTGGVIQAGSGGYNFRPHHDYIDRTDMREAKEGAKGHNLNTGALFKQPLLDYNVHQPQKVAYNY